MKTVLALALLVSMLSPTADVAGPRQASSILCA
jgi:hypothetical protein